MGTQFQKPVVPEPAAVKARSVLGTNASSQFGAADLPERIKAKSLEPSRWDA